MDDGQTPGSAEHVIAISTGTIFRVILVLLVLAFLFLIKDVVAMFFAALFLAALIDPFADYLEARKIPRGLAVLIVYFVGLSILTVALILILPPVLSETRTLGGIFSPIVSEASGHEVDFNALFEGGITSSFENILNTARGSGISAAVPQILAIGTAAFGGIFAATLVLILAFYLVVEKGSLVKAISFLTPPEYQPFVLQVAVKVRERLGHWLRGQLILMFSIFLLTYLALELLGIPYALVLALVAGILEVIPFVGPLLSGVPAVILGLAVSPFHALAAALSYFVIQSVEGNILVPKIMQKVTGISPIISLLAVLIGWRLGGIVGAILSIPLANAVSVFLGEVYRKNNPSIS
jgi:predicted PurR-regulated permease PerM